MSSSLVPHRFSLRAGISLLALGLGVTEAAFIFTARRGLTHGGHLVFLELSLLALLRFVFQDRIAVLETRTVREVVLGLRRHLLEVLNARAVPAYRPDFKKSLTRALEETIPRVGEGFLARQRCQASILQGLVLIPCLFFLSWRLALLSLLLIFPAWLAVRWRSRSLRALERAETSGRAEGKLILADFSEGLEASAASLGNTGSGEKGFGAALLSLNHSLEKAQAPEWSWRLAQARYPALLETGFFFALAALVLIGGASLGSWESWILFSGLLLLAYRPVREAARYYPVSLQGTQALGDVEKILKEWEAFPKRIPPALHPKNSLALENVNFGYEGDRGRFVLRNFSAEFPADAITGITGPNGAGKTTLLRLLAGAEIPLRGDVLWPEILRSTTGQGGISYLPQRIAPGLLWAQWAKTAMKENPALWEELNPVLGLEKLLKPVHSESFSGGERQRMAFAKVLFSGASFLILDEPTTALPGDERQRILEEALNLWTRPFGARRIRRGALIVSHEAFLAKACDQMFALSGGEHAFRPEPKSIQP